MVKQIVLTKGLNIINYSTIILARAIKLDLIPDRKSSEIMGMSVGQVLVRRVGSSGPPPVPVFTMWKLGSSRAAHARELALYI